MNTLSEGQDDTTLIEDRISTNEKKISSNAADQALGKAIKYASSKKFQDLERNTHPNHSITPTNM